MTGAVPKLAGARPKSRRPDPEQSGEPRREASEPEQHRR